MDVRSDEDVENYELAESLYCRLTGMIGRVRDVNQKKEVWKGKTSKPPVEKKVIVTEISDDEKEDDCDNRDGDAISELTSDSELASDGEEGNESEDGNMTNNKKRSYDCESNNERTTNKRVDDGVLDIIGGKYKGTLGVKLIKATKCMVLVEFSSGDRTYLSKNSVVAQSMNVGGSVWKSGTVVDVIGGTYTGHKGLKVLKGTDKKVLVEFGDGNKRYLNKSSVTVVSYN